MISLPCNGAPALALTLQLSGQYVWYGTTALLDSTVIYFQFAVCFSTALLADVQVAGSANVIVTSTDLFTSTSSVVLRVLLLHAQDDDAQQTQLLWRQRGSETILVPRLQIVHEAV